MSFRLLTGLPPQLVLPPKRVSPPKAEPWFETADKEVRKRHQILNSKFSTWLRRASPYLTDHGGPLKTMMQELGEARSDFRKHSRKIKEYLLKELTALYNKETDGYPCEFFSASDRMLELSNKLEVSDRKRAEAYRALSKIEQRRQSEEDKLERMQETFEEADWALAQDRDEESRHVPMEGQDRVGEDEMALMMDYTDPNGEYERARRERYREAVESFEERNAAWGLAGLTGLT